MTDIYATVAVPADQVDTANTIGGDQWQFIRALTDDSTGQPPATHYGASGMADAALLALIVASIPGVLVDYSGTWQEALAGFGLYLVVQPEN